MAVMFPNPSSTLPPLKRRRRTATSVLAGDFDPRPTRDVLTSLLNGVPVNKAVEGVDEGKIERRRARKERAREKKAARLAAMARASPPRLAAAVVPPPAIALPPAPRPPMRGDRPVFHLPVMDRARSETPPPMPSSPPTTPGPSISSSTSRTSSKRPHTPDDFDIYTVRDGYSHTPEPTAPRPRKKRVSTRKGWKGWVEVEEDEVPEPSDKLINLDEAPIITTERKTRSGKNFDGWV